MVHKLLNNLFDSLIFGVGIFGVLFFFLWYSEKSFQIRYAEVVIQEFLWKAAVTGKVTKDEYDGLCMNLYSIDSDYDLELQGIQYFEYPEYQKFSENELKEYFQKRNVKSNILLEEYFPTVIQEKENELNYQRETNASLLAAEKTEYLPMPSENTEVVITAVRPKQEVYVGEKLITLCQVFSQNRNYYVEAEEAIAKESGKVNLEVVLDGIRYQIPVQVTCYPRVVECNYGHKVINDKKIIEKSGQTGRISCPYCQILPEQISTETMELTVRTKEKLTGESIRILVEYLDGSSEYITPESEEWQDNYDAGFCGKQMVTIRYRNAETQIMITTENSTCLQCGNECNDRGAEDYDSYPYCLECLSQKYIFTGEIHEGESIIYEKELISTLDTEQEFLFNRGDFLVIKFGLGRHKTMVQKKILLNGMMGRQ